MTKKRGAFLTFICSLLPGAGEMFMGFMKIGVSLMGLFFVIVALASWLEIGPLVFVAIVVWFYSFFHVHNLRSMPDEEFYAVEDDYLFHISDVHEGAKKLTERRRKIVAIIVIIIGIIAIYRYVVSDIVGHFIARNSMFWVIEDIVPKIVIAILIIAFGIYLIRGKKKEIYSENVEAAQETEAEDEMYQRLMDEAAEEVECDIVDDEDDLEDPRIDIEESDEKE